MGEVVNMVEQTRRGAVRTRKADVPVAGRSLADASTAETAPDTSEVAAPDASPLADERHGSGTDHSENMCDEGSSSPKQTVPVARKKDAVTSKPDVNGDVRLGFLSDFVGFHLRLAQDASYRTFAKHHDKDLIKPGRYPALAIIHLNPGISQSALGRAIARDKSTVSPLIKDLQKNGFINRKASTQDRRSVTLALTKKGERTLDKLHARAKEHEEELDRLVGPSKVRLMSLLSKIITSMSP